MVRVGLSPQILLMVSKVYVPVLVPTTFGFAFGSLALDRALGLEAFLPSPFQYVVAAASLALGLLIVGVAYTDLVIEVNPRHVRFYASKLGFEPCGAKRMDSRIGAPAVLLRLALAHAETEIARLGGHAELAREVRASLYPLFFSPAEEQGIEGRLRSLHENPQATALPR